MSHQIELRQAKPEEIEWINAQYDKVGFKHSVYENESIAIALLNGEKAGLGRLQRIDNSVAELGGMFVDSKFRNLGIASKIVAYLLEHSNDYEKIYCLPFAHLESFYQKFGFGSENDKESIPCAILEKHGWCNSEYDQETLLFVMNK